MRYFIASFQPVWHFSFLFIDMIHKYPVLYQLLLFIDRDADDMQQEFPFGVKSGLQQHSVTPDTTMFRSLVQLYL